MYCKTPYSSENADYVVEREGEDEIPVAVPSIKVLKPGSLYDSVRNQGESCEIENSSHSQGTSRVATAGTSAKESVQVDRPVRGELDSTISVEYQEEHEEIAQQEESGQIGELRDEHLRERDTDLTEAVAREVSSEQNPSPSGGAPSIVRPVVREAEKASGSKRSGGARALLGGVMPRQRLALMKRTGVCASISGLPAGKRVRWASQLESHERGRRAVEPCDSCISDTRGVSVSMTLSDVVFAVRPSIEDAPVGSRVQTINKVFNSARSNERVTLPQSGTVVSGSRACHGRKQVKWEGSCEPTEVAVEMLEYGSTKGVNVCVYAPAPAFGNSTGNAGWEFEHMAEVLGLPCVSEPFGILITNERLCASVADASEVIVPVEEYPSSTWEALVSKEWREWMEAVRSEHEGWVALGVFKIVNRCDMEPGAVCVDVTEVFEKKHDGRFKLRTALRGDQMRKDIDYQNTFSATVAADSIRLFFCLAAQLGKLVKSLDVKQAYLQADQNIPLYAFLPSYIDLVDLNEEQLLKVRREMLALMERQGKGAIKRLAKSKRRASQRVMKILKAVYGDPAAGHEFGQLLVGILTSKMGYTRSKVDRCIYFKTKGVCKGNGEWYTEYVMVLTWTDDLPYFGTDAMVESFEAEIVKHVPEKVPTCVS